MNGYRTIEAPLQETIYRRFHVVLTEAEHQIIKTADNVAAIYEQIVFREQRNFTLDRVRELLDERFVVADNRDAILDLAHDLYPSMRMEPLMPRDAEVQFMVWWAWCLKAC